MCEICSICYLRRSHLNMYVSFANSGINELTGAGDVRLVFIGMGLRAT